MEEERRLCYVGMTRAGKRLVLTWARFRRRFGGGEQERIDALAVPERSARESDCRSGRETTTYRKWICTPSASRCGRCAQRNIFTGKTYNSVENISQFFNERGSAVQSPASRRPAAVPPPRRRCPGRRFRRQAAARRAAPPRTPSARTGMTWSIPNTAPERWCGAKAKATTRRSQSSFRATG